MTTQVLIKDNYYSFIVRPKLYYTQFGLTEFEGLPQLYRFLTSDTFLDNFDLLFNNVTDWVFGIRIYPFDVRKLFNQALPPLQITLNNVETNVNGAYLHLKKAYYEIGRHQVLPYYNNFLDTASHTKISIYLPFLGTYDLPVNNVLGAMLSIRYIIDTSNGDLTCNVVRLVNYSAPFGDLDEEWTDEEIILSCQGKIGYDLPLGQTNANDIAKQALMFIPQMIGSVASGNIGAAVQQVASIPQRFTLEHFTRGNISSGEIGFTNPTKVKFIIERPNIVNVDNYAALYGKPLYESRNLNNVQGFTIIDEIHLDNVTSATSDEIEMIQNQLREGVIF